MVNLGEDFGLTLGSPAARPAIRCSSSCSTARTEAPPPFDTLEAMTIVFRLLISMPWPRNWSLSTEKANLIERSTLRPQSFSGLRWECACLKANRLGVAALNDARSPSDRRAVEFD